MILERLLLPIREPYRFHHERLQARLRRRGFACRDHDLPGASVHAWEGGEGPPVVLLQGFGSDALMQWAVVAEGLAGSHRVIMPDMLWFGRSRAAERETTLEKQGAAVLALLDRLGLERAHVVGSSYGGFVAWGLALSAPERVRTLTLVGSPGNEMTPADVDRLKGTFGIAHPAELIVPEGHAELRRLVSLAVHPPPRTIPGFVLKDIMRQAFTEHREARRALVEDMLSRVHDPGPLVSRPTLLLWGRHDPVFPVDLAERLAVRMGERARLHVIEKAAHAPHAGRPAEVIAVLKPWLEGG